MRPEHFKEIQLKQQRGSYLPNKFYAIVSGKVEQGHGEKKEWVQKTYVVGGAISRLDAENKVQQFITDNNYQIKSITLEGIYRENR